MLFPSIKHPAKYLKLVEVLHEHPIMMPWEPMHVLLTAHKEKYKKENKWFIPSPFIKLML
jgi:hypothetical protein